MARDFETGFRWEYADGLAGQAIMVWPTLDMAVVVTSASYIQSERERVLVSNHIRRAVPR